MPSAHHHHHDDHDHDHDHEIWHDLPQGFADRLELEALLSAPARDAVLNRTAHALGSAPARIIDLGSGTGADAVALAQHFPTAHVHALDVSTQLLDHLGTAVTTAGVADRISGHVADLNGEWTAALPSGVDLVWAALTLHHVHDPDAVLRQVRTILRPGGVLVLTELTGATRLDPADLGTGSDRLREHLGQSAAHDQHAVLDWSALLEAAGLPVTEHHDSEVAAHADTPEGARHLATTLRTHRARIASTGIDADVVALDAVIHAIDAGTSTVSSRSPRTTWIATRPLTDTSEHEPEIIEADVAVLGGGPAGLAAAIALGRSRRTVAVVDAGQPRNAPAAGIHNMLGNEGVSPHDLLDRARAEAGSYGARTVQGTATALSGTVDDFTVEAAGTTVHARRVILATGLVDDLPDIPGVRAGWGHSVLHCAFCHGWEIRDRRIAILARDALSVDHAMMFSQLSDQVTVFLHDAPDPTDEQWDQLRALGVRVVRPRVRRLVLEGTHVQGVEIDGGTIFDADAVVVVPRSNARTEFYEALGGAAESTPFGRQIPTDARGATEVRGVFAVGNASQPMATVVASAASGVATGASVHLDLASSDLARAVNPSGT